MKVSNTAILLALLVSTAACSKGGNLVLEPGARAPSNKGTPFVRVTQGGHAQIIQSGHASASTGVHASITIQPMSSHQLEGSTGHKAVINKASK